MKFIRPSTYLRFLNALDCLDRINPSKDLDPIEERLLSYIAIASLRQQDVLVGDLISMSKLGSQATLHGRVKNLVAMDYVKLIESEEDGRKKFVVPTSKAEKYFDKLSACLEKACKS